MQNRHCNGGWIATYPTLGAASEACSADSSCGCVDWVIRYNEYYTNLGTKTVAYADDCSWVS